MNTVTVTETKNEVTVNETTNTVTVQEGVATVVTVKTEGPQGPALSDGDKGDVTISSNGTAVAINTGAVTSAKILDGTIVNADISASAAIQGTKINPNFSGQNIVNTGTLSTGNATVTHLTISGSSVPLIDFVDSNDNPDFSIRADVGSFRIKDTTSNVERLIINSDGHVDVTGNLDVGAGLDVTGNIVTTGDLSAKNITLTDNNPTITWTDTDNNPDYRIEVNGGNFTLHDITNAVNKFEITPAGNIEFVGHTDFLNGGVDITGDLTVSGNMTVSGTTTTIDTTTLTVEDKNIELGKVSTPTDTTADGGGITLKGATDKTFQWLDATDSWTSSENIALPDNKKILIGSSQDLEIYHNGTDSIIDNNTGVLRINSDFIYLKDTDGGDMFIKCIHDGAVELNYDGSKKFETSSGGVIFQGGNNYVNSNNGAIFFGTNTTGAFTSNAGIGIAQQSHYHITGSNAGDFCIAAKTGENINFGTKSSGSGVTTMSARILANKTFQIFTGNLQLVHDNQNLQIGNGQDLEIYHDGSNSYIDNSTGNLFLRYGTDNGLKIEPNLSVQLFYDGSKKLETTSTGVSVTGGITTTERVLIGTTVEGEVNADDLTIATTGNTGITIRSGNTHNGVIQFSDATGGTGEYAGFIDYDHNINLLKFGTASLPRFQIDSSGNVQIPNDTGKLQLGASQDLEIYHSGTQSFILNNTGNLILSNIDPDADNDIILRARQNESSLICKNDGGVELYFDNVKKFETLIGGAELTGNFGVNSGSIYINNDSQKLYFGASQDLEIFHDGSVSRIKDVGTGGLFITTDSFNIKDPTGEDILKGNSNAAVELYYDNSKKFETTSTGAKIDSGQLHIESASATTNDLDMLVIDGGSTGFVGGNDADTEYGIQFKGCSFSTGTGIQQRVGSQILMRKEGTWNGHNGGGNRCDTTIAFTNSTGQFTNGTLAQVDRLLINSDGNVQIPNDTGKLQLGASQDLAIFHDGSNSYVQDAGSGSLILESNHLITKSAAYSFQNNNNTESLIYAVENGKVELFFDNSSKLETNSTGIATDNVRLAGIKFPRTQPDSGNDFMNFGHGGASGFGELDCLTGMMRIKANEVQLANRFGNVEMLTCNAFGAVEAYHNGTKRIETTSTGVDVTGKVSENGVTITSKATALSLVFS